MANKNFREASRSKGLGTTAEKLTIEQLNCGSMLRIADAVELMAKDKEAMERDLKANQDTIKNYNRQLNDIRVENRSLISSRGKYKSLYEKMKAERDELIKLINQV